MTMTETNAPSAIPPAERDVADFLQRNPDYLARHPDILATQRIPHRPSPGVTSLVERQVRILREQNARLESQLSELLRIARQNERVGARLLALGRGLLEADSLSAVVSLVREVLVNEFAAELVWVRLLDQGGGERSRVDPASLLDPAAAELRPFQYALQTGESICGGVAPREIAALVGQDAVAIRSASIIPLTAGRPLGLIVLGSCDGERFQTDMGTLFLAQLAELVTAGVIRYTDDT